MAAAASDDPSYNIESHRDWAACESFTDLRDVNIRFLKGEIYDTPYHLGPICKETTTILQNIIRLNERGFITTGSQPSYEEDGQILQRSYIQGFINMKKIFSLVNFVKQNNLYLKIHHRSKMLFDNFPERHFCATMDKKSNGELVEFTWIQSHDGENIFEDLATGFHHFANIIAILQDDYAYVEIANSRWDKVEVSELLVQFLE